MIKLKTPPADEPLEMEEAKTHLRVDGTDEDDYIQSLIIAARKYCENFQNRAYILQSWELWLDEWPERDFIALPLPPLSSVTSVKWYSTADVETTVYEPGNLTPIGTDTYFTDSKSEPGRLCLKYGKCWPSSTLRPHNGVCITFVAGYGYSDAVPQTVKQAILLLVGHFFEHREAVSDSLSPVPMAVDALLWQERAF